ncbi:MAG TPA: hypothetical protein VHY84_24065 [Bryobacteraceae bacterium]|jgi:hypothetical protein|nr:hypothetical protein [Bryobacteraceae bacterium]
MKTKLIAGLLLAGSCLFAAPRISIGVGVGVPVGGYGYYAPAPAYVAPAYVPPQAPVVAAPGYIWMDGFWGAGHVWHRGYWTPPRAYVGVRGHFRR